MCISYILCNFYLYMFLHMFILKYDTPKCVRLTLAIFQVCAMSDDAQPFRRALKPIHSYIAQALYLGQL